MRKPLLFAGLVAMFVLAFAIGYIPAAAAPATDQSADVTAIDQVADGAALGDELLGRRLPRLRPILRCARIAHAVVKACPCTGPVDGEVPWPSQADYLGCVKGKLAEFGDKVPERCANLILQRAEKSGIGLEGYECPPKRPERPGPGDPGPRPDPQP